MSETAEMFHGEGNDTETSQNKSIFHDRYDGHFMRWLGAQGLALDASDETIIAAMEVHCDTHNTTSISHVN